MNITECKVGQRVSATYSVYTNRLGTIVDVRGSRAEVKFDDGFDASFSHGATEFLSLIEPSVLKSDSHVAPLDSTLQTLDALWLGRRVRIVKEGYKHHGKEGVVVSSSPVVVRFDDGSHDAPGILYLRVIATPIEADWRRVYDDGIKLDVFATAGLTEMLHAMRRRAIPFIWLSADGVETAHIVDGVSEVYFMATVAKIADDSFKWTLHENKRLMRIGFSSDLKTAKEDAEKFCRKRMAVHREPKETK